MDKPKVLIWDLETAGVNSFKADLSTITCFGYKWLGEKETHCLTVDQFAGWWNYGINDKPLVEEALKIMNQADMMVAHFGDKFDRRFFQGRVVIHGLTPPPPVKQRDTWRIAKTAFALSSNRLDALAMALDLKQRKHQKSRDEWPGWWLKAMAGCKKAIHDKAEYCKQDVRVLEKIYLRIRAYDNLNHPRLYSKLLHPLTCGMCGGRQTYRGGYAFVGKNKYRRMQCTEAACQRWDRESVKVG